MEDPRQLRKCGSILPLGGVDYQLEAVEGMGGSAVVYRARYPDELNRDAVHQVFIKELFPFSPKGEIVRASDGSIICSPQSAAFMEHARQRFRTGNQINLELLQLAPAFTAGNLNSYEAYGTYYSVLSIHGGKTLLHELETRGKFLLRDSVQILRQMLRALEVFHRHHLLHLDISPDNILLLPEQVLLIDFNSAWDMDNPDAEDFSFSCKQGYSAPEVLLQNLSEIGPATDLYACCAVWFHLFTGRQLRKEEQTGGLRRSLSGIFSHLEGVPQTAIAKTTQILIRGLHPLARKRYQKIEELRTELNELIDRLDGFGVTRSALWETSAAQQKKLFRPSTGYLSQPVRGEKVASQEDLVTGLEQGGKYLLTGPGGMGKSRLLMELWKKGTTHYQPQKPVYLYLSLKDYQACAGESHFVRESLLKGMHFSPQQPYWKEALHMLDLILQQPETNGRVAVVLLLDGLNEAGPKREPLLQEIEALSRQEGVGVLVTDRTDAVLTYGLQGFSPLALSPLTIKQEEKQLSWAGAALPQDEKLCQLLTTPMLLFLYVEAVQLSSEAGQKLLPPANQHEMVKLYLERFCQQAIRSDSGNQGRQLCSRYIFQHLLPDIAWEMERQGRTILSVEDLVVIARKSYQMLHSLMFGVAFPDYLGKTRLMLEKINSAEEWFDYTVREQLTDQWGLLVVTPQGQFTLLHDNFLEPLAQQAEENRRLLTLEKRRRCSRRTFLVLAIGVTLVGLCAASWYLLSSKTEYTEEENALIYDALASLNLSLGMWSFQIAAQQEVLEQAAISDVLDNQDSFARQNLREKINLQIQMLESAYAVPLDLALLEKLRLLEADKPLFSVALLEQLCDRYAALEPVTRDALTYLEQTLCDKTSAYNSRDKRERLVIAYQEYLEAEIRYVSFLLATLMAEMTPEQQQEILEAMTYMEALEGFYDGPGSVEPKHLSDGTNRAFESLKDARREMNAQGFPVAWPD